MADVQFNNNADVIFYNTGDVIWSKNPPSISTQAVSDITGISAIGHGTLIDYGGESFATRIGFCYKKGSELPTILDLIVYDDGQFLLGTFVKALSSLDSGSSYQIRAFALNPYGVAYGDSVSFNTVLEELIQRDTVISSIIRDITSLPKIKHISDIDVKQIIAASRIRHIIFDKRIREILCVAKIQKGDSIMLTFSAKQSWEEYFVTFNFTRVITPSTTIASATVIAYDAVGLVVTDTLTDVLKQSIVGSKVFCWVRGGSEQIYKLTCRITMSNGEKFEQDGELEVTEV